MFQKERKNKMIWRKWLKNKKTLLKNLQLEKNLC